MTPPLSAPQRLLARIGTTVHKYRIERLIGIGGMAAVYAAMHRDGQRVAIKFMLEHFQDDPSSAFLFNREALMANQIGHPGAVPVLAHDVDDEGNAYLVMPLLEGETLRSRWERQQKRLPIAEVGAVMLEVLDILGSAHVRRIVHRDVKPENIFLTATGDVRVLDFGIARRIDRDGSATWTGVTIGTPAFMPPEQALGKRDAIGPHSDCWAAGATIFALLSGEFVHMSESAPAQLAAAATQPARSLGEIAPNVPRAIVDVVDTALAFDPPKRWSSAREMRDAWRAALEEAIGESATEIAKRIREERIADLRELDATAGFKKKALPTGDRADTAPRERADLDLSGVETKMRDLGRGTHLLPVIAHDIYVKHGLGHFSDDGTFSVNPGSWWPVSTYAACLHEIAAALGPTRTFELQKLVQRYVSHRDPNSGAEDIHTAFSLADIRFHRAHRKNGEPMYDVSSKTMLEGIGHIFYRGEPGDNFIAIESSTYAPCDMQRGAYVFLARRYEPHAVVEHGPGPCRKKGDASCIYHITWW